MAITSQGSAPQLQGHMHWLHGCSAARLSSWVSAWLQPPPAPAVWVVARVDRRQHVCEDHALNVGPRQSLTQAGCDRWKSVVREKKDWGRCRVQADPAAVSLLRVSQPWMCFKSPAHQHVQQALVPCLRQESGRVRAGGFQASSQRRISMHALHHVHLPPPLPPTAHLELSQPPAVLAQARRQRVQQAGGAVAQRPHQEGGVAQVRHIWS